MSSVFADHPWLRCLLCYGRNGVTPPTVQRIYVWHKPRVRMYVCLLLPQLPVALPCTWKGALAR
jgi:hypothetical protein